MELIKAVKKDNLDEVIKLLVNTNIDPNFQDGIGCTALIWASHNNNPQIVELLLNYNTNKKFVIDPNIQTKNGCTALFSACFHNHIKIVKLLLDYKINGKYVTDPLIKNMERISALIVVYYKDYTEIIKLLENYVFYKDNVNKFTPSYYNYILTILIQKNRLSNNKSVINKSNCRFKLPNEILELIKKYGIIICGKYD